MIASCEGESGQAVRAVVDAAFRDLGRIDVLVNNAGDGLLGAAEEATDDQIAHQIATNLTGSIQVAPAALPHLRAQGGGRIIQISTMGGQATFPGGALYHTSKWGVEGFMDALRQDVAVFNIGVSIVEPGSARTEFRGNLQMAPRVAAYDQSPAGQVRAYFASGRVESPGDPAKMAAAIIASADQHPAPRRIALGSAAYAAMHAARAPRRSRGAERPRPLDRRRVTGLTTPGGLSGYVRGVTCAPPRRTRE